MGKPIYLEMNSELLAGKDRMIEKNVGVSVTFPLHTHNFYEFFLVTSGRALHLVNNETQVVSRGSLVFVRPSDEHYYDYYKEDDFEFWNAGVNVEQFRLVAQLYNIDPEYFDDPLVPRHVHLPGETTEELNRQMALLKRTPDGTKRNHMFIMNLSNIIYYLLTAEDAAQCAELPSWMLRLIYEMDKPVNFVAGLPRLIELANYSQAHINRAFRQYLYTTPTHYINDLRLRHAYKLLTTTDMSILHICDACGFNNVSYFYTVFKRRYSICPNDVRTGRATHKKIK